MKQDFFCAKMLKLCKMQSFIQKKAVFMQCFAI